MRVLLVDDEADARQALIFACDDPDLEWSEASDGQELLDRLATDRPDVIVLDLVLPKINGWEVLERMEKDRRLRTIPVVVLSGYDEIVPPLATGLWLKVVSKTAPLDVILAAIRKACQPC